MLKLNNSAENYTVVLLGIRTKEGCLIFSIKATSNK